MTQVITQDTDDQRMRRTQDVQRCAHFEKITDDGVGTCVYCGQVKQYSWDGVEILVPGRIPMETKQPSGETKPIEERARTGRKLTRHQHAELAKLGVDAFVEKHNLSNKSKGALTQSLNKIMARKAVRAEPQAPGSPLKEIYRPDLPVIVWQVLELLPSPGGTMSLERLDTTLSLMRHALKESYVL